MSPSSGFEPIDRSADPLDPANLYEDAALESVAEALNRLCLEIIIGGGALAVALSSVAPLERAKVQSIRAMSCMGETSIRSPTSESIDDGDPKGLQSSPSACS